jgi:hypothetical protein
MKTIWKFPLAVADIQAIEMPVGARLLDVQMQRATGDQVCLWALVDPSNMKCKRWISIHGTGHELPDGIADAKYVGTFQLVGGSLVFHVFDHGSPPGGLR